MLACQNQSLVCGMTTDVIAGASYLSALVAPPAIGGREKKKI